MPPADPSPRPAGLDLRFRAMRRDDLGLLSAWLAEPHVHVWWREPADRDSVDASYGPALDGSDPTRLFIVERDGAPLGMIQWYLLRDNPAWLRALAAAGVPNDAAGIDYLIGTEEYVGRGIGPAMIDLFLEHIEPAAGASAVVVAVHQGNRRSWRALEKIGFLRVWAGELDSDDPSDEGPHFVYLRSIQMVTRPTAGQA
jgi:aminoglycoside 6'-N-acetyltransferase